MNDTVFSQEMASTRQIKFFAFVILEPPALICNILLVYYLLFDRTLRQNLYYHSIAALLTACLLTNLIVVPRIINYLYSGHTLPETNINCLIWQWCDYLLFGIVNILIFCVSMERFLLILYSYLYGTARRRFIFHYLPIIILIIYITIFYTAAILMNSCELNFNFGQPLCGFPCYTMTTSISLYDTIVHSWLPLFGSTFVDVYLVIQVVHRRQTIQRQRAQWRKYRKMLIQLIVISSLYLTLQIPFYTTLSIRLFTVLPDSVLYIFVNYIYYFFWLLTLLLPFVCIGSIPEIVGKLKHLVTRHMGRQTTMINQTIRYNHGR